MSKNESPVIVVLAEDVAAKMVSGGIASPAIPMRSNTPEMLSMAITGMGAAASLATLVSSRDGIPRLLRWVKRLVAETAAPHPVNVEIAGPGGNAKLSFASDSDIDIAIEALVKCAKARKSGSS